MAKQLFSNNASSLLAASIDDNDLAVQVGVGDGALFPNPGADEFFTVALVNPAGDFEIVKIASRSSDILTVASGGRGQEGTSAQSWTNGQTRVELRNTKGTLDRFIQREGDVMSGDLDMDDNEIKDASLTGDWKGTAGQLVGTKLRGTEDDASNEVAVPSGGGPATAGGSRILTVGSTQQVKEAAFVEGQIVLWYGAAVSVPAGWAICNGSNGTPDLRDRVVIGVSGTKSLDANGGSETASGNTDSGGSHSHTVASVGAHALTVGELPAHHHKIFATNNSSDSNADGWGKSGTRGIPGEDVGPFAMREQSNSGDQLIENTGSGDPHDHSGGSTSSDGSHTHALSGVSVMQPWRALHYIMFIGF